MIFLGQLKKISDNNMVSAFQHLNPFDSIGGLKRTENELNEIGILIESLPEREEKIGMQPELHVNPQTKKVWYEYIEMPKSNEELTKETIENLQKDNASLLKENVKKDAVIESLSKDVAEIYKLVGGNK